MSAQERGEIIPFERGGPVAASREEYEKAIHQWCHDRNAVEVLSREELGAMDWTRRMDAQRKALIMGFAQYFREHERADVAPGVLLVLTLMSDNEHGAAQISQETMAKLFGRSRTAIYQAQVRLKEAQLIVTSRGRYSKTSPVIPRVVAQGYNHLAWLVGAIAQNTANCKDSASNSQLLSQPEQLNQLPSPAYGLKEVNCQVEPVSIAKASATQLLSKNSTTLNRAASVVAAGLATAMGSLPAAASPPNPPMMEQPARLTLAQMSHLMMDAAGPALANPASHPGLLTYGELQRWLAAGCDFEGDILPAIRSRSARAKPSSLKSWSYFAEAVADQKAIRERPMPEGRAPPGRPMSWEDEQLERKRKLAEALRRPANG